MIRLFKSGDEKAIAALESECFSEPWSENAITQSATSGTVFAVFEKDEKIVGYAGLQTILDEGYITNIAVASAYRRCGIGASLVEHLKSIAYSENLSFISLEVRQSNSAAQDLYRKHGFSECGIRKNFYTRPTENALIMTFYCKEKD